VRQLVLDDARAGADRPTLRFAYTEEGERVDLGHPDARRDLKPPPAVAAAFLREMEHAPRAEADLAAGFFSDVVEDRSGRTKPTALHHMSGQQTFLGSTAELREGLTVGDVERALRGPWERTPPLPALGWDTVSPALPQAFRAHRQDPQARASVPGANWLAAHALALLPVHVKGDRLETTGFVGRWGEATFTWPLWREPLSARLVTSMLRADARALTREERDALGVCAVFTSQARRTDHGYGTFSPALPLRPPW
jgi:hypothetical protein